MQNLVTLFDGATLVPKGERRFENRDETIWLDEYRAKSGRPMVAFWQWHRRDSQDGTFKRVHTYPMPSESFETRPFTFEASPGFRFERPVLIDVMSGRVYEFPQEDQVVHSRGVVYANVPVYDSPFVMTDFAALDGIFAALEEPGADLRK